MMSLSLKLRKISDWVTTLAGTVKDTVEFTAKSGLLKDHLEELCERAGVAGSVFKLGAMFIEDTALKTDAETRIVVTLARKFVTVLDEQLSDQELISEEQWTRYQKKRLEKAAEETLGSQFTWLKVIGKRGRVSSRNWPLVNELANFARRTVWGAATVDAHRESSDKLRDFADLVRGKVHEALARCVDELVLHPDVERAFQIETPAVTREALELLNEAYVPLESSLLFDEIPQDQLFIPPTVRVIDFSESQVETNLEDVPPQEWGEEVLVDAVADCAGQSKVFVVTGEMGVGKSCLLRVVAARLAGRFLKDKTQAVVCANWRPIHNESHLIDGISHHITNQYGLQIPRLEEERQLVFVVDGFDEMSSHESGVIETRFRSLVKLSQTHQSPVIVAMRSTIITNSLQRCWKDENVTMLDVEEFSDSDVDQWAKRWRKHREVGDLTGDSLRELCRNAEELTRNPLLLFMLARVVQPLVAKENRALTRSEIFRTFVDETIRGKARLSGEQQAITVHEQHYRILLQEIAWIASWPKHGGKCPTRVLREHSGRAMEKEQLKEDQGFEDLRSAFVLHFFEPGEHDNEFEFHPEGFRHYLLAEWCVRTQVEAMLCDRTAPSYPYGRKRTEACNALAQVPLQETERHLLNELYEELPLLCQKQADRGEGERLEALGGCNYQDIQKLFECVHQDALTPPDHNWHTDTAIGIPDGQDIPQSLDQTRLLVNHWDQSWLALFGLARAFESPKALLEDSPGSLLQFLSLRQAVRGHAWRLGFDLSAVDCSASILRQLPALEANLRGCILTNAILGTAILHSTDLTGADLRNAHLANADLRNAHLANAHLTNAYLTNADLRGADLTGADLTGANLIGALLANADLRNAYLTGADLTRAIYDESQLSATQKEQIKLREE